MFSKLLPLTIFSRDNFQVNENVYLIQSLLKAYILCMAIRIEENKITLSVLDLVNLNHRSKRLLSSFPLPQRGLLGQQAQAKIQQRKNKSFGIFHREVFVSDTFNFEDFDFTIQGRIDGLFELKDRLEVEEIKSVVVTPIEFRTIDIDDYPEFAEQVLVYSYLLQKEKGFENILPVLTLVNLINDYTKTFRLNFDKDAIESLIQARCRQLISIIKNKEKNHLQRIQKIKTVSFTLSEKRKQQIEMMSAVEHGLENATNLLVSAPTGT